jgi:hypothetical protein
MRKNETNCEYKCKLCGVSRKDDPHYNDLYRSSRYGRKFCICRCHSPFSPKAKKCLEIYKFESYRE